jgi:hypothetical protein
MSSNIDIKVLKGPYGLIWRDGKTNSKEWSEFCYDINMWGCDIVWDKDSCQAIPVSSKDYSKWLIQYKDWWNKTNAFSPDLVTPINKAIKKWEETKKLKQSLNPETTKTFEELIDEL